MVGTTMAWVTPSARTRSTQTRGSKVSTCTTRRPEYVDDRTEEMPAMWYGGTLTMAASSSPAPANSTVEIT